MRTALIIGFSLAAILTVRADTGLLIVIPGKPGVPVIINGGDASYAVVEGEWGLARNFKNADRVFGGWYRGPAPEVGHYYPTAGRTPGYGRLEVEPAANRVLPQPAESYSRSWSAQSAPPAPPPQYDIPAYPMVIEAPPERPSYRPNGFRPDLKR